VVVRELQAIGSIGSGATLSSSAPVSFSAPGNRDCFVHMSRTFGDNADPNDLLSALRECPS
jgi:hypothetical protein